ncbi:MAG: hypothetical protein KA368_20850 [Acidobacteria bacterium]|nr:hypothetical protein [Acidobacteriota bacterium]
MKHLFGICACLVIAVGAVAAQQDAPPPKPTPSIQPTAEALMKAQAAADKALAKPDESFVEELKKLVEREIAKSAALPVTTTVQEPVKQTVPPETLQGLKQEIKTGLVVIDGAVYMRIGTSIVAMPGSECFLPEAEITVRRQRAKAKFAEILKAEAQAEPIKKD